MRGHFNNNIPRTGMPVFPETSTLRSPRDPDVIARAHYKHNDVGFNLVSIVHAVRQIQSQLNRLRMRGGQTTAANGIFKGEYDPTQSYIPGDWFKISPYVPLVISGTTITPGFYCIRPAASAVDSQNFGPWAGTLPANPATAGIDLDKFFFNPDATFPTFAAAPNDKLYAELTGAYC